MNFADNLIRNNFDYTFIKISERDFSQRDEANSSLWSIEKERISYDKSMRTQIHLYKVPVRAVKIGESIYTKTGMFETYRSS